MNEVKGLITADDTLKLNETYNKLETASIISFDFETTGLDFISDYVVGISLATDNDLCVYIPTHHDGIKTVDEDLLFLNLKKYFEADGKLIIAHNLKFDIQFLWNNGIDIGWKLDKGLAADTMILSWLLDENRECHKLKYLARTLLHYEMVDFSDLTRGKTFSNINPDDAVRYALLDAYAPLQLYYLFMPQIKEQKLEGLFWKLEMRYLKVLSKMERRGVYIDVELLDRYQKRIEDDLQQLEQQIYLEAGRPFNIKSGDQLGAILFAPLEKGGFGAPIQGWTKGGKKPRKDGTLAPKKPTTDADAIRTVGKIEGAPWTSFCKALLRYKALSKISSTYIIGLKALIRADGKIHCSFNQDGTVTGRISSSDPNLQNQPAGPTWVDRYTIGEAYTKDQLFSSVYTQDLPFVIPDDLIKMKELFYQHKVKKVDKDAKDVPLAQPYFEVQRKIRDIYYNPYGVILVADYSQMEMRVMAHFSGDPGLLEAFEKGVDIHTWVASKAFKIPYDKVTKDLRSKAKSIGFGTIYGKTVHGFASDWYGHERDFFKGIDNRGNPKINPKYLNLAQGFLDDFFAAFQGVANYMDQVASLCYSYGYIKTMSGRRRRLPDIYAEKEWVAAKARRQAINTKIQGSSGDLIKLAQIHWEELTEGTGVEQVIQVHDEVVNYASRENADQYLAILKNTMESVYPLKVQIISEADMVTRWGHAK